MRYLLSTLFMALIFVACGGPGAAENEIPEELGAKKDLLKAKRLEAKQLNALVKELELAIADQDSSRQDDKRILVTTKPLALVDFKHFVELQGSVQAENMVSATSEVAGRILSLTVKEGDMVKRGQLIAKLDLESVKKQMLELGTSISLARTVFERQKRLWDQNIGSEIQYLEAKSNLERLEKSMDQLTLQLSKENVYAPTTGEVETVNLHTGEVASPGMPIIQILNINILKVVAEIPETYLGAIRKGEQVKVKFPAINEEQELKVTQIGNVINPANRTFEVEIKISRKMPLLKPNLLALVLVNDQTKKGAITVPLEVVQQEVGGKDFVFVTDKGQEGTMAKKVYVTTGESYEGNIVITKGLEGNEELIIEGARGLTNNALIEVVEDKKLGSAE
ncbi:MAG: RND transporter [Saprospiraceae bacterium]|nr:MAG: RND transporter [Saprospiraceae bacterium]